MNYIVIISDAMRADFLYNKSYSPHLHDFFTKYGGIKFMNAYSSSNWTQAVKMSILTGFLPSNNGLDDITYARHEWRAKKDPYNAFKATKVSYDDFLVSKLKKKGYKTKYFGSKHTWRYLSHTAHHLDSEVILWDFLFFQLKKIKESYRAENKPFYWMIWDNDAGHDPWGVFTRNTREDLGGLNFKGDSKTAFRGTYVLHNPGLFPRERLMELAGLQMQQYDLKLKAFLEWFLELGLQKDTAIIITSDHGEGFWEKGVIGHAVTCTEPEIRVPMFIYHPTFSIPGKIQEINDIVSIIDLGATILEEDIYGEGINLFKREKDRIAYFEFTRKAGKGVGIEEFVSLGERRKNVYIRGLRHNKYKLIFMRDVRGETTTELYDLSEKREETRETAVENDDLRRKYLSILAEKFGGLG